MPIFEYRCLNCDKDFETLVMRSEETPQCPSCDGTRLEKQLSVFAVGNGGELARPESPAPCGSCGDPRGPGACSIN